MDIHLAGAMDGIVAAEIIQRQFHLPVIFLTAYSEDATLERAKTSKPYGYVLKPFAARELKSTIEIALYRHRSEEEIRRLNRLYDVLSRVSQTMIRASDRDELLLSICHLLVDRGDIDLAWIGTLEGCGSRITPVAFCAKDGRIMRETDFYPAAVPEGSEHPGRASCEDRPLVCNRCGHLDCSCLWHRVPAQLGHRSCGSFPLRFRGKPWGALNICVTEPGFFCQREEKLMEEVGADISFALDKIDGDLHRKRAEESLKATHKELEIRVQELKERTLSLEEANTALKVLLKYREKDRKDFGESVLSNVKNLIQPCLARLKATSLPPDQQSLVEILESHLHEITSSFSQTIGTQLASLTPTEIRISTFIRDGMSTSEIANILCLSERTIECHRVNIRKKLGLRGSKNRSLRSFLLTVSV
jgi:DNA-binding NarL/FixJ family response regulator